MSWFWSKSGSKSGYKAMSGFKSMTGFKSFSVSGSGYWTISNSRSGQYFF